MGTLEAKLLKRRGKATLTPGSLAQHWARFSRLSAVTILILLISLTVVHSLAAQEGAFDDVTSWAEYRFGQFIRFSLYLTAGQPVNQVTLFINAPELANTLTIDIPLESSDEVMVEYLVDLAEQRLSPFTAVFYKWRVQDIAGNVFTTHEQTLEYIDDRYQWQVLEKDNFLVHWTGEDPAVGQAALDSLVKTLPGLQSMIPGSFQSQLRVYVYPSLADLQAGLRLTGREWVGAHAHPELGVIMVAATNPRTAAVDLDREIAHELSHLMLYQATRIGYGETPLWFEEGLATVLEPGPNGNYDALLRQAIGENETIPLDELCRSFPPENEILAYAESASIISYIRAEYGNQAISQMVMALRDGADCRSMVQRSLDLTVDELYVKWLTDQANQSSFSRIWQQGAIWLILLTGFVAVIVIFVGLAKNKPEKGFLN